MTARKLADLYPSHLSPMAAAGHALSVLGVGGPAFDLLLPLVIRDVELNRRSSVHDIEDRPAPVKVKQPDGEVVSSPLLRTELLEATFSLGDGRMVRWGEATVEDHQARIDFLTRQILGTQRTIGRHADAVALITSCDAKNLDEVASGDRKPARKKAS